MRRQSDYNLVTLVAVWATAIGLIVVALWLKVPLE